MFPPPGLAQRISTLYPLPDIPQGSSAENWRHTHQRYSSGKGGHATASTGPERAATLEWHGDKVLAFFVADLISQRLPDATANVSESSLVQLVKNSTLSVLAQAYGLQHRLSPPPTDELLAAHPKILADALETYIGAAHRSGNTSGVQRWVNDAMGALLDDLLKRFNHDGSESDSVFSLSDVPPSTEHTNVIAKRLPEASSKSKAGYKPMTRDMVAERLPSKHILIATCRRLKIPCSFKQIPGWQTIVKVAGYPSITIFAPNKTDADYLAATTALEHYFPEDRARVALRDEAHQDTA